jgi:hypothetical protein
VGKKKTPQPNTTDIYNRAVTAYNQTQQPSQLENEYAPIAGGFQDVANRARDTNMADYSRIMGGYGDFTKNLGGPTKFSFNRVSARRPEELGEAYGYLREAVPGYRDFAATGGYSNSDIQELRARGISPIRAAYGNTMMELDRARALGGNAGAPNYIAALSRAQRELPGQMADAMTTVNAGLADSIRQGKLAGLAGLTGIGGTMGGLSSDEAGRMLQADLANQGADLQVQGMNEASLQNLRQMQLAGLSGQAGLYGTTPAMAATFGNQALNAWQNRIGMEDSRLNRGLGYLGTQLDARRLTQQDEQQRTPWWKTALGVAGTVAPYAAMAFSSRNFKTDIKPSDKREVKGFAKALKNLPLYTWRYKGDDVRHFGPIAEEFKEKFGVGDGKTLHLVDVMGVMLAAGKEAVSHA